MLTARFIVLLFLSTKRTNFHSSPTDHLLIMEALGGNARWRDRFLGYHVAIGYYWAINLLFLTSPAAAYEFMELLESHAVDTYSTFYKEINARL